MDFFIYRLPHEENPVGFKSNETQIGFRPNSFVVAPFERNTSPVMSIPPDEKITPADLNPLWDECVATSATSREYKLSFSVPADSTSRREHADMVRMIISEIRQGFVEKCVISRVDVAEGRINLSATFSALCQAYPAVMVFCFHTPESGLWIGASPEKLFSCHGSEIDTMALAGSMPADADAAWDKKNIVEHQLVSDFIEIVLASAGLAPHVFPRETVPAGPVKHLRTRIRATAPGMDPERIADLAGKLSPTPALAGFPVHKSIDLISRVESHDRGYYGGYFGFVSADGTTDLYVNLRSMLILPDKYCLFAGGGIMEDSTPEEEWAETEVKISTLKSHIIPIPDMPRHGNNDIKS